METFLVLNGREIIASVDEQEEIILGLAVGTIDREQLVRWLKQYVGIH